MIAKTLVNENNFGVTSHRKKFFLFIGKLENYLFIVLRVLLGCRERKYFCHLHSLTIVDNEARSARCSRYFRHSAELYPCQSFYSWGLNLFFVISLEVVQIAKLARLADSFATNEALMAIESQTVVDRTAKTHIQQNCTDCSACSTFSRVAVNNNHISWVL